MTRPRFPETRFVMFSIPRSGTSYIVSLLRSHPDVLCHGEALLPRHIPNHLRGSARKLLTAEDCETDPVLYTERLYRIHDCHKVIGCKVFLGHSPEAHVGLAGNPEIRKIFLKRENLLAAYSSRLIAAKSGVWNAKREGTHHEIKAQFDPAAFDRFIESTTGFFQSLESITAGPVLQMTYADQVLDQKCDGLFAFLGLDGYSGWASDLKKQLSSDVLSRFDDPEAVEAHLARIGKPEWAHE